MFTNGLTWTDCRPRADQFVLRGSTDVRQDPEAARYRHLVALASDCWSGAGRRAQGSPLDCGYRLSALGQVLISPAWHPSSHGLICTYVPLTANAGEVNKGRGLRWNKCSIHHSIEGGRHIGDAFDRSRQRGRPGHG